MARVQPVPDSGSQSSQSSESVGSINPKVNRSTTLSQCKPEVQATSHPNPETLERFADHGALDALELSSVAWSVFGLPNSSRPQRARLRAKDISLAKSPRASALCDMHTFQHTFPAREQQVVQYYMDPTVQKLKATNLYLQPMTQFGFRVYRV